MPDFHTALEACAGMVAIDLGANVGEFTLLMAEKAQRVIAFEPDPWSLEKLREATSGKDNVEIVPAAASIEAGQQALYRHSTFEDAPLLNSQSSSLVASKANVSGETAQTVDVIDFPKFLNELNAPVGVLKMDIEGAEVDILERLFAQSDLGDRVKYIFCETHERSIPDHKPRVDALRRQANRMSRPKVNLYWH